MLMSAKPLVLVVNGSPRKYGSSTQLSYVAAKGVEDAGGVAELVHLYDYDVKPCIGCVSDGVKYCRFPCVLNDDFNKLGKKVLQADGLIISTPVYWYAPSGVLKNFIDRLTSMENMIFHEARRSLLEGKVVGFIATGLDAGVFMTVSYLMSVLNSMGAVVAPWSMAYTHSDDVTKDSSALMDAYNVGYLVVETIKALKAYGKHIGYNPSVNVAELAEVARRAVNNDERNTRIRRLEELLSATLSS